MQIIIRKTVTQNVTRKMTYKFGLGKEKCIVSNICLLTYVFWLILIIIFVTMNVQNKSMKTESCTQKSAINS